MYRLLLSSMMVLLTLTLGGPPVLAASISAAELLDAKVDYTADFSFSSEKGTYHGTVIHAPGRERRDFDTAGGRQALLLRRDIDQAVMMWPERKWYVSTSFASVAGLVGGFDGVTLDRVARGHDTVGGEPTTRYDVTAAEGQAGAFTGRMWFTKDGILMKMAGQATFSGRSMPVQMELRNLQRIKSDPAAFVLPADYKGIPLDFSKLGVR